MTLIFLRCEVERIVMHDMNTPIINVINVIAITLIIEILDVGNICSDMTTRHTNAMTERKIGTATFLKKAATGNCNSLRPTKTSVAT